MRLVSRGLAMISGVTPSDASHVLGRLESWDAGAARKALALFAKRRNGHGDRIAAGPEELAQAIIDRLTAQTVDCLLEAAFAEDGRDWGEAPEVLARHALMRAGLDGYRGVLGIEARLGVPVIGLGASAPSYYGAVGQVTMHVEGTVTSPAAGTFVAHTPDGPERFAERDQALFALEQALSKAASDRARRAGVEEIRLVTDRTLSEIEIEGSPMFIEARLRVTAKGRPRIATG
jgi:hypothetical protein